MPSARRLSAVAEDCLSVLCVLIVLIGSLVCLQPEGCPTEAQRLESRILAAIESRSPESYPLACDFMNRAGAGAYAIALAAEAAAIRFDHDTAVRLYGMLPVDQGRWEFHATLGRAKRFEILGRTYQAELELRRALELAPYDTEANSRLGHLLQISGRTWEASHCFLNLVQLGKCRGDELLGVAAADRFFRSDERLEAIGIVADPPELMTKLAKARRALYENRQADAEALLRDVLTINENIGEAQGRLGRIIFDRGDNSEFMRWIHGLPAGARLHPEVWLVQGLQCRRQGRVNEAVRCFLEALLLWPNHLAANIQIAGCLKQIDQSAVSREFTQRGDTLVKLEAQLNRLRDDVDPELIRQCIASLADLGRYWEAAGWSYVLSQLRDVPQDKAKRDLRHWVRLALQETRQNAIAFCPELKLNRSDFPEPDWNEAPTSSAARRTVATADHTRWHFRDDADRLGIHFQYYEGTTEANRLQHIFNVVGGGLAATDYDLDGWHDLYVAQANDWRNPGVQSGFPDQLFRNLGGQQFINVTEFAGLGDLNFTHGVATGDFDQDGFPDLYLGNLGPNRLYRNNGDGSFTDVTMLADVAGDQWTTSSVFADFSGDGLPDLYVANYALRSETADKECRRSNGELMACTPDLLNAEFHRLYVNNGDGSFRDITTMAGMHQPNGRGLGVVAWDFAANGRLGLFVANDTSPNFLFINNGSSAEGMPRFEEVGVVRGVAFDIDGRAQACMGVAAGDINGDGNIDMFITNFFGESDTLYSQQANGLFFDATQQFNLRDAGFWMLGFGCQFADFDGDGWEDLVVTNGHVDQRSARGDPDRTPPQLFRNRDGLRFDEIDRAQLGAFFQQGYLGRGLAKWDWNRDGRPDFAISHLHGSLALVTNETPSVGFPLVIRLSGRSATREATGATVMLDLGDRKIFRLATGGDGYLVTNDHGLHFAVPRDQHAVNLEVRWPGGHTETWKDLRPDQEIQIIEGRRHPVVLRSYFDERISDELGIK